MAARKSRTTEKTVIFEITTVKPLRAGQQVFIAGNQTMLGAWRPDGLPLTRMDENTWVASAIINTTKPLEFKITRGTWETEAVNEDGSLQSNIEIDTSAKARIVATVKRWRDD